MKLAAANYSLALFAIVTGPLQARALGPSGRGDLAAILVPLGLLPSVATLGFGSFAIVATARGVPEGRVAGTVGALFLVLSGVLMALAVPIASSLADGREVVYRFLVIGLLLAPVTLLGLLALDLAVGRADWDPVLKNRIASALLTAVPIPVLYVLGDLTVASAAAVSICAVLANFFPWRAVYRRRPKLRVDRAVLREALTFGPKSWIGGLAVVCNAQLDQLLMIDRVSPAQLGLYAIGVSFATFLVIPAVNALMTGGTARVVQRDAALVLRSSRFAVLVIGTLSVGLIVCSPVVLPLMFGHAFRDAVTVTALLCLGNVPLALGGVYGSAISNIRKPGIAARAEFLAVLVTVPGLLLTLGPYGIKAAAVVSVSAYCVSALYLFVRVRREFGGTVSEYLVPRREDVVYLGRQAASMTARLPGRRPRAEP